jgi:type IV secretory pathway VirB10-like protein
MLSNRLAFVALAIACIGAAAGGGYLATRQNTVPASASAQVQPAAPASAPAPSKAAAVTEKSSSATSAQPANAGKSSEPAVVDAPRKTTSSKAAAARQSEAPPLAGPPRDDGQPAPSNRRREPAPLVAYNNAIAPVPQPAAPVVDSTAPTPSHQEERPTQEPIRPVEPPQHTFSELVVSAESVIGLQTETRVSSESARVEDRVEARVTRDVRVGDHVAIPAGSRAIGAVMQVERGGKFKERARLGIRFHTLVLADGTRIPISTETIFREGDAPGNSSSSKVGGATVGGAILGAILGGGKGAAIGAGVGAGAGTAVVASGDRNAATLPAGTAMTVRILQPITITTDSKE